MQNHPPTVKTTAEKLAYLRENMVDKTDSTDEFLLYFLKEFNFDEKAMTDTWNTAVKNADLESDRIFYERIGYIGYPLAKNLHKFFDCPVKAEKAFDDANLAAATAYVDTIDKQFYDLVDGIEHPIKKPSIN